MGRLLVQRTEVTRGEYLAVVGSGPRLWAIHPDPVEGVDRNLLPATHLNGYDAVLYANARPGHPKIACAISPRTRGNG